MYEKTTASDSQVGWAKNNRLPGSGLIGAAGTQAPPQETLPGVLSEIEKLASQLVSMTRAASDNLVGPVPCDPQANVKQDRPSTILFTAFEIRGALREAVDNQQRTLNGLAL